MMHVVDGSGSGGGDEKYKIMDSILKDIDECGVCKKKKISQGRSPCFCSQQMKGWCYH